MQRGGEDPAARVTRPVPPQTPGGVYLGRWQVLARSLKSRVWEDGPTARQTPAATPAVLAKLQAAGLGGLRAVAAADPRRLEAVACKPFPFGSTLQREAAALLPPALDIKIQATGEYVAFVFERRTILLTGSGQMPRALAGPLRHHSLGEEGPRATC